MFRLLHASAHFSEIAQQCVQINGGIKYDDVPPSEGTDAHVHAHIHACAHTHLHTHKRNPQKPLDVFKMSYMAPLYIASKT